MIKFMKEILDKPLSVILRPCFRSLPLRMPLITCHSFPILAIWTILSRWGLASRLGLQPGLSLSHSFYLYSVLARWIKLIEWLRWSYDFHNSTPGSGKSLHVAERLYHLLRAGRPTVCNFPINLNRIPKKSVICSVTRVTLRLPRTSWSKFSQKHFQGKSKRGFLAPGHWWVSADV